MFTADKAPSSVEGKLCGCYAGYFGSAIIMFPTQILAYLGTATGMRFFNDFADNMQQANRHTILSLVCLFLYSVISGFL